jgi:hypothetical protein
LNVDGNDNYFRFIEVKTSTENHLLSCSSSVHIYHVESNENTFNIATLINRTSSNSKLLFATNVREELLGLSETRRILKEFLCTSLFDKDMNGSSLGPEM